jgi:epoxyqueuosine reductase QueG
MTIDEIFSYIKENTALYGVADFEKNRNELITTYGSDICKYPKAISLAIQLKEEIINRIPEAVTNKEYAKAYRQEYFDSHERIKIIAKKITKQLRAEGYNAVYLDVSGQSDELELKQLFAQKTTACLAGIGWLGKNALLTTKEYGPRLTWATVLTDAPIEAYEGEPLDSLCADCLECVNICPSGAISNNTDPKKSYNPQVCGSYIKERVDNGYDMICGQCLYICPYGRKSNKKL